MICKQEIDSKAKRRSAWERADIMKLWGFRMVLLFGCGDKGMTRALWALIVLNSLIMVYLYAVVKAL